MAIKFESATYQGSLKVTEHRLVSQYGLICIYGKITQVLTSYILLGYS
jgi:hypothetical protein